MKKFIYTFIALLFTCLYVQAANITFLNGVYTLQDVKKDSANYMNLYIKNNQTIENWSNIISVYNFAQEDSEFDYINGYIRSFSNEPQFKLISFHPEINMFSYGLIFQNNQGGYIEYNIIKCKASSKKELNSIKYTHKYNFTNQEEFAKAVENCFKNDAQYLSALSKTEIPKIVKKKK